ncbi:MAG: ribonuclease P protein component [Actinobacteria bacterium]|nr:ribonuclease P protein component [Actinomycetota bacterium]
METLRNSREFKEVIDGGEKSVLETITIFILPNHVGQTRIGISVSRKLGGSVKRNKIKRRIREAARRTASEIPKSIDLVVIARKAAEKASYQDIEKDLAQALSKYATTT